MKFLFVSLIFFFLNPCNAFSQGKSETVQNAKQEKTETQSRRRKKVMMCHECGKPETECDCEGEGHGVDHKDDEDESSKE
jgi:hypothetical protein